MNTKIIAMIVVGAVVIGGGSFFAGTKYQGNEQTPRSGNFPNMGQNGGPGIRAGQIGGMTIGEILSKDDTSITVKLPDGGSKIVFFTEKTIVSKNTTGSITDLVVNENVIVNGSVNSDGSVSAQNIQLGSGVQGFRQDR